MATKELYHIIVINEDGENELPEARTLSEAIKTAKAELATGYYSEVKIYHRHELKRQYMRLRNGKFIILPTNKPQATEIPQISTIRAKVESLSAEGDKALENAHKSQIEAAIALSEAKGESGEVLLKRMERNVAEAPTEELRQIALRRLEIYKELTDNKTTPQSQNKCRVSSVLATAHELYNAAFIGSAR